MSKATHPDPKYDEAKLREMERAIDYKTRALKKEQAILDKMKAAVHDQKMKSDGAYFLKSWGYADMTFSNGKKLSEFVHLSFKERNAIAKSIPDLSDQLEKQYNPWKSRNLDAWLAREEDDDECLGWE